MTLPISLYSIVLFLLDQELQNSTCSSVTNDFPWGRSFDGDMWSDEAMSINGPIKGMRLWILRNGDNTAGRFPIVVR